MSRQLSSLPLNIICKRERMILGTRYYNSKFTRILVFVLSLATLGFLFAYASPRYSDVLLFTKFTQVSASPPIPTESKYAYATLMTGKSKDEEAAEIYFTAARMLTYQLLHAPETRSNFIRAPESKHNASIPFIIMVTKLVPEEKRSRLRKDGAIVLEIEDIDASLINITNPQWAECFDKLRAWELVQFDRIVFTDLDMILQRPIDGIFNDPATATQKTLQAIDSQDGESPIPSEYVFAGLPQAGWTHSFPPKLYDYPNIEYLNAGLIILKPDIQLFKYYQSLLKLPDRFNPEFPEQNLWNYAHRRDGNMPWMELNYTWSTQYPRDWDVEGGVAMLHDKWYKPWDDSASHKVLYSSWESRMREFYDLELDF